MNFEKNTKKQLHKVRVLTKSDRRRELKKKRPTHAKSSGVVIRLDRDKSGLQDFFYSTDD